MAGLELKASVVGSAGVRRALEKLADEAPEAVARALYQMGVSVWAEAVRRAPVEFGVLRSSGYAAPPMQEGSAYFVQVGFGVKYAIYQHEGEYRHPRGGERHFLRKAVASKATLSQLAAWARENLARGLGTTALAAAAPQRPKVVQRARARAAVRRAGARVKNRRK